MNPYATIPRRITRCYTDDILAFPAYRYWVATSGHPVGFRMGAQAVFLLRRRFRLPFPAHFANPYPPRTRPVERRSMVDAGRAAFDSLGAVCDGRSLSFVGDFATGHFGGLRKTLSLWSDPAGRFNVRGTYIEILGVGRTITRMSVSVHSKTIDNLELSTVIDDGIGELPERRPPRVLIETLPVGTPADPLISRHLQTLANSSDIRPILPASLIADVEGDSLEYVDDMLQRGLIRWCEVSEIDSLESNPSALYPFA